jgi:ribosomal protein S18 acetylase RimI-like enzyme
MAEQKEASTNPIQKKREIININNIAIDKKHQKQGIGKKLYNAVVNEAKRVKANAIELTVFGFNKNAIAFYENIGMSIKNIKYEQKI